jgi:hypothetical protein
VDCSLLGYPLGVSVRATVRNGRLIVDQPTDLPEGTVLDLVVDDEGLCERSRRRRKRESATDIPDQLDDEERQALNAAISRSLAQAVSDLGS